ncbi:FecR family protein [Chryseobacterium indologenes]|uniref:FecR family protein n=1 Tax=Chryseobacterium indologenes TaxID=253 RepID=UPI000B518562|nr:FecR family protein [Chryseobacterium indologenes]ASE62019.1 FecR family protein [Chryseobacterium indologenes]
MERKDVYISFEIGRILKKIVQEEPLSVDEHIVLNSWLKEDKKNEDYFQKVKNPEYFTDSIKQLYKTQSEIQFHLVEEKLKQKKIKKIIRYISIAAGFLVVLNIGLLLYIEKSRSDNNTFTTTVTKDVPPGSNKATITFSDGKSVNLQDPDGIKVSGDGITYTNGKLVSVVKDVSSAVLKTPRGGQYHITLSDGTKVWLNSGSSLKYPVEFSGIREVTLTGEAYFEVHHDPKHPFLVNTDIQQIKVLGTRFNIRAYEEKQYTTLVQGSVEVKANGSTSTMKMKPNEQAIINNYSLSIQKVDALDFVAWKQGLISSGSISLFDLSKEVERWWDVDFKFSPNFKNTERAYLTINRNENLSSVLRVIEKTYGVKAEIHGKEVDIR